MSTELDLVSIEIHCPEDSCSWQKIFHVHLNLVEAVALLSGVQLPPVNDGQNLQVAGGCSIILHHCMKLVLELSSLCRFHGLEFQLF